MNSVIFRPKPQNIEIRSSVQQRPIFTIIYHSCPRTQGLITPYMVNKPLTCSRQYVVHKKESLYSNDELMCAVIQDTFLHCTPRKEAQFEECGIILIFLFAKPFFFFFFILATPYQCAMHLLEAALHKQTTPEASLAG